MAASLCWAGLVVKMGETRIPRMLLFGELELGTQHVGRPLKRYKDQFKATLKQAPRIYWEKGALSPSSPPL